MGATLTPSTPRGPSGSEQPDQPAFLEFPRSILTALAAFVALAGIVLGLALITGATVIFNVLVFTLFTVLWVAFAAAVLFSPRTMDGLWRRTRALPLVMQALIWLLFLPLMIGLWIWERTWSLPIRLVLVAGLAAWNIYMFFPRV